MNLISKAKVSFRMLKIQHPSGGFESYMKMIRILILESVFGSEKMNFGQAIRIPDVAIRIPCLESVSESEKMNFG